MSLMNWLLLNVDIAVYVSGSQAEQVYCNSVMYITFIDRVNNFYLSYWVINVFRKICVCSCNQFFFYNADIYNS